MSSISLKCLPTGEVWELLVIVIHFSAKLLLRSFEGNCWLVIIIHFAGLRTFLLFWRNFAVKKCPNLKLKGNILVLTPNSPTHDDEDDDDDHEDDDHENYDDDAYDDHEDDDDHEDGADHEHDSDNHYDYHDNHQIEVH